jgi:hypothetical protein
MRRDSSRRVKTMANILTYGRLTSLQKTTFDKRLGAVLEKEIAEQNAFYGMRSHATIEGATKALLTGGVSIGRDVIDVTSKYVGKEVALGVFWAQLQYLLLKYRADEIELSTFPSFQRIAAENSDWDIRTVGGGIEMARRNK